MQRKQPGLLQPDWEVPARVRAVSTTREGGVSQPPFDGFNLGLAGGDDPRAVMHNRRLLRGMLALPHEPRWLRQVHGIRVVEAARCHGETEADAAVAFDPGVVCVVMTADCLPVLFCDRSGTRVGAAHAGWRGLVAGVLEATVDALGCDPGEVMAWMGPCIGPAAFEVGDEVRAAFLEQDPGAHDAFTPSPAGRWLADLRGLARRRLSACGLGVIRATDDCTFSDDRRFYSYRRDGNTGRMASLIWLRD